MKSKIITAAAIFLLVFASTGHTGDISVGVKAGSLGAGLEVESSFMGMAGIRIGMNYFTYDMTSTFDDVEYTVDLTLKSLSAILDWHPFKGDFRISGGLMYNGNNVKIDAKRSDTYEIGGQTYDLGEVGTLKGDITFNDMAPYLGVGWDTSFGRDNLFGLVFELGAIYQGTPEVDLTAEGPIASDQTFQSNLAQEEKKQQEDLDNFKYYPVISFGVNYRF